MDGSDDIIRFDFRDPYNSDGDDLDNESADGTLSIAEDFVEEYRLKYVTRRSYATNTEPPDTHVVDETSERENIYPYVLASDLERSLQSVLALLGHQHAEEGTSVPAGEHGGSSSPLVQEQVGNSDDFLISRNDSSVPLEGTGDVILPSQYKESSWPKQLHLSEMKMNEKPRGEVQLHSSEVFGGCAASFVEVPIETWKKGVIIKWNEFEGKEKLNTELGYIEEGKYSEYSHDFSGAVTVRSVGTPKETLETSETLDPVTTCQKSQKGMIHLVAELAESYKQTVPAAGKPHETAVSVSSHQEAPDVRINEAVEKEISSGQFEQDEGEQSTATSRYCDRFVITGPSDSKSSVGKLQRDKVASRWERLQARLRNSGEDESSCVCSICGIQQNIIADGDRCNICSDGERNFLALDSEWIRMSQNGLHMHGMNFMKNSIFPLEGDLTFQIFTNPTCFQGHRAILLKLPSGNILWDCLTYINEEIVVDIARKGGLRAIAISSPDRISACARMSYIFNRCPIYLHERNYLTKEAGISARKLWEGPRQYLGDGVSLIHIGGHFPGSCILHLDRRGGIVFSGNTLKVGSDRESVSIMLHYGNYIPICPKDVRRALHIIEDVEFVELWGDQPGEEILEEAKLKVITSLQRYMRWTQRTEEAIESETVPLTKRELIARGKRKIEEI